jgi:hypothetical protein
MKPQRHISDPTGRRKIRTMPRGEASKELALKALPEEREEES